MEPVKRQQLILELRRRIATGRYPAKFRLSPEPELAAEFGVARETMRGALRILGEEGLLERLPRQGTFVRAGVKIREPVRQIYLLVPCPDYFIRSNFITRQNISELLSGTLAVAHEQHCQVIMLPLSNVNTQQDIAWDRLECLNSDSRVIFYGNWFSPVYPLIQERQCKAVHIHSLDFSGSEFECYVRKWHQINLNSHQHSHIVQTLVESGCRRIAIFQDYLFDSLNPALFRYREAIATCGQTEELFEIFPENCTPEQHAGILTDFYQRTKFDALICSFPDHYPINYNLSLNANLNLPESIVIVTKQQYEFNQHMATPIPFTPSQYHQSGVLGCQMLLSDKYAPGETFLP